jgi:outer membrane protein
MLQAFLFAAALAAPQPPGATPIPLAAARPIAPLPAAVPKPGIPQSVTLQQAIDIAAARSPVLAAARANYRITQIPVQLAKTAIFPNISATATSTHSNSVTFNGRSFGSSTSKGLNASIKQLIYDGGKFIAQIHQARASAVAGADTYERALETLAYDVSQAYYAALQSQSAVQLDRQLLKENQTNEALTQAQVRTGVAPRLDLVTAHVPTVQAEVALISAQGAQASALGAFANQLGLDPDTLVGPINNSPPNPAQTLVTVLPYDRAVAQALEFRPDYLSAQYTAMAAQYNVQVQRSGLYPTLSASGTYGTNSTLANGTDFAPSSSVGFSMSIPIFDQGITRAQTEQAQAQLDLANADLAQTKLTVELNVQQALVGVISDQAAVSQAETEVSSAQQSLAGVQAQYKAGVTTLVSLLQAQVNLTSAQTSELNAVYALRQAEQAYVYALGQSSINPTSS